MEKKKEGNWEKNEDHEWRRRGDEEEHVAITENHEDVTNYPVECVEMRTKNGEEPNTWDINY